VQAVFYKEFSVAFDWKHSSDNMDWDALSHLYRIAPLGEKKPADLQVVFSNSLFKCFVYEGCQLIGAGRALADGMDCSYICDIAVHPEHQGVGLGKDIVAKLVGLSRGHKKIILYAVAGKEPFYRKLGFRRMLTAMAIFANQEQAMQSGLIGDN
jgi:ribosomal protein S18 acetylase RimI-like enzyme